VSVEAACVVPGLVNAHAHLECDAGANTVGYFAGTTPIRRALTAAANARLALAAGVTSIRDLGASNRIAIELRDEIARGRLPGPNVVAAGNVICMTGGHGSFVGHEADGVHEIRKAVRQQRRDGADWIKFIATGGVLTPAAVPGVQELTGKELTAGVREAHRLGLKVAAHAIGPAGIIAALRAGVDSIEHGHLIDDAGTPFNGHDNDAHEIELMHTLLGLTPREALRAATVHAADLIGSRAAPSPPATSPISSACHATSTTSPPSATRRWSSRTAPSCGEPIRPGSARDPVSHRHPRARGVVTPAASRPLWTSRTTGPPMRIAAGANRDAPAAHRHLIRRARAVSRPERPG
jgi:imidazolonepropionase-like amidohydrolase